MNPEQTADGSLEQFEEDLERLLVAHVKAGVPKLAIPTVLDDRARSLERMGCVRRDTIDFDYRLTDARSEGQQGFGAFD